MSAILTVLKIAGSLGLFLYGMKILSDGLQKATGEKMRSILQLMTKNRFLSVITGLLITVIIQSSSATTVMVVSFVNASLINLVQAIGVIMGANIGTTVTGWIVALLGFKMDITSLALCSIAVALPLMFSAKTKRREVSEIFLGFGLLFFGLTYLQHSMPDISRHTAVLEFLSRFNNGSFLSIIVCILIGTLLTIVVQSSSATMAITITMAYQGWIGVNVAAALCLGQNIGTTITAYIASIGTSTNAKRAAWAHILFNVIGSVIALILFRPMLNLVNSITPGDIYSMDSDAMRESLPTFLAMYHTLFNLVNTVLFFPFIRVFAKGIERLVPNRSSYADETYHFTYIANSHVDTPELYLLTVKKEIQKMGALTCTMYEEYQNCFGKSAEDFDLETEVTTMKKQEDYADQMQEQLTSFCVKMLQDAQTPTNADTLAALIRVIDELESITDSIYNLTKITEQRITEKYLYTDEERNELTGFLALVSKFLFFTVNNLDGRLLPDEVEEANSYEEKINEMHQALAAKVHKRMADGTGNLKLGLLMLEVERNLEHIGDYCINIVESYGNVQKHTHVLDKKKA
jgi:Na/Pi-cotransporter